MNKPKTITAVIKNVGAPLEVKEVANEYETLKSTVCGWIEAVYLEKQVICWINEEGKLIPLPLNFYLKNIAIHGNAIFTGSTYEGETVGLTEAQIAYVKSLFAEKPNAYQKYIDTFFKEKDLPVETWTYQNGNFIRIIDSSSVIAFIRNVADKDKQKLIRQQIVKYDFINGDFMAYLKNLADYMFALNL